MSAVIHETTCPTCDGFQLFEVDYESPDYSVGLFGGWFAVMIFADNPEGLAAFSYIPAAEQCSCSFTDKETEEREMAVAKDYRR